MELSNLTLSISGGLFAGRMPGEVFIRGLSQMAIF
jgi:hypothetical protein